MINDLADKPHTLAIDIGGTRIKGGVLDGNGSLMSPPVSRATQCPAPPVDLLAAVGDLARDLPSFQRASVGFPGLIRSGIVVDAWRFVVGEDGRSIEALANLWEGFDLCGAFERTLRCPAIVVNDADMHGAAVVSGVGLEVVVTLGTGFGTAVFFNGIRLPHMDLAFHPFRDGECYSDQLGNAALVSVGGEEWNHRLRRMVEIFARVFRYDHLYVGGGNARLVRADLGPHVRLMDNRMGLIGGYRIWEIPECS